MISPTSRKIALFFDGTWNTPGSETNVYHLFQLTQARETYYQEPASLQGERVTRKIAAESTEPGQIKYYHRGVGVDWGEKIRGGVFGYGLSSHIRQAYLWLGLHYQPGDEVYIFGFSRGAYTARSLIGLIRKCGFLRTQPLPILQALARKALAIYREKLWQPDGREAAAFQKTFSWPKAGIHFIGVWDTVGALGIPVHNLPFSADNYRWHDTELSGMVHHAFHALALDEHRPDFNATVWAGTKHPGANQLVEQRWFPGAHADVGGGYLGGKLHQIPLRWMQDKAACAGLLFKSQAPIDPAAHLDTMHDSLKEFAGGLYAKLPWIYPNYRRLHLGVNETIDDSVRLRLLDPAGLNEAGTKYAPPSLAAILGQLTGQIPVATTDSTQKSPLSPDMEAPAGS